jgi:DNA topoisomerase-1
VGELIVKKSKRGKTFYSCSQYPACDAVFWSKPVKEPCPNCKAPFLLEKTTKKQGTFRHCANEDCGYNSSETGTEITKVKKTKVENLRRI